MLVWTIIEAPNNGWTSTTTVLGGALAVGLFAGFVVVEIRRRSPILDVRLFTNARFSAASGAIAMAFGALFGFIFVITQYFQAVRGYDTLTAGLATLPFAVVIGAMSPVAIVVMKRIGTKLVVAGGLALMGPDFLVAAGTAVDAAYWGPIVTAMSLMAAGLAFTTGPATEAIMGALSRAQAGAGSAVNDTAREVGGTLGVAVIGSVLVSAYGPAIADSFARLGYPVALSEAADESVMAGLTVAATIPGPAQEAATFVVRDAFMAGLAAGSYVAALATALAAVAALVFLPARARTDHGDDVTAAPPAAGPHLAATIDLAKALGRLPPWASVDGVETPTERELLDAARAGDAAAFDRLVGGYLNELYAHCYRMLGSVQNAEDALQESLLGAWRGLAGFEGRSSLRTWLYRISANACLRQISRRPRRMRSEDNAPAIRATSDLGEWVSGPVWLEPLPDEALLGEHSGGDPAEAYLRRESVELAFVAALQHLPGTQRAVLILRDVLGLSAAKPADILGTTRVSVNSALQRARAAVEQRAPRTSQQVELDALGTEGAARARDRARRRLGASRRGRHPRPACRGRSLQHAAAAGVVRRPRGRRPLPPRAHVRHQLACGARFGANGQLALACYQRERDLGPFRLVGMNVLTLRAGRITSRWTRSSIPPSPGSVPTAGRAGNPRSRVTRSCSGTPALEVHAQPVERGLQVLAHPGGDPRRVRLQRAGQ